MKKKWVWILIAGHGGINPETGEYVTAPSKQHQFDDGVWSYEGVHNRKIVEAALAYNSLSGHAWNVEMIDLLDGDWRDIPRTERIKMVGKLAEKVRAQGKEPFVFEIHNNAFNTEAEGRESWTTKEQNFADVVDVTWLSKCDLIIPEQKDRGQKDKNWHIVREIKEQYDVDGALMECFFFDNRKEFDLYANPEGYLRWGRTFVETAAAINKRYA